MAVVDVENIEPFRRIRNEVAAIADQFLDNVQEHFDWLDEILETARQAFNGTQDIELLPKTPSEKRKRGRTKRGSVKKRESSAKNRGSSKGSARKSTTAFRKASAAILELTGVSVKLDLDEPNQSAITEEDKTDDVGIATASIPPVIQEDVEEGHLDGCKGSQDTEAVAVAHGLGKPVQDHIRSKPCEKVFRMLEPENSMEPAAASIPKQTLEIPDEVPREFSTPQPVILSKAALATTATMPPKITLTVPTSGSRDKILAPSVLTPRVTPTHPVSRYTPQKTVTKDPAVAEAIEQRMKQQLVDAATKRDEILKQRIEEQKRKREERALKVAKQRLAQQAKDEEAKRKIEEKYCTPHIADVEEKRNLRPRYPESSAKRTDNERAPFLEKEKAKERERILREQEEMRRLESVERDRQQQQLLQQKPPPVAIVVKAENKADSSKYMPSTKPKDTSAFEEPKDTTLAKVTTGAKASASRATFTKPANTSLLSANHSALAESYEMTPLRKVKPSTASNYDISDLRSSDETDDEEHPRKKIPAWAQGGQLKMALTQQYYNPPDLNDLFGMVQMPDLTTMFTFQRKRFHKRTSSATWDSPIHPHGPVHVSGPK